MESRSTSVFVVFFWVFWYVFVFSCFSNKYFVLWIFFMFFFVGGGQSFGGHWNCVWSLFVGFGSVFWTSIMAAPPGLGGLGGSLRSKKQAAKTNKAGVDSM